MSVAYLFKRSGILLAMYRLPFRVLRRVGNHVNSFLWKRHLKGLGKGSIIEIGVLIESPKQVVIGDNCLICSKSNFTSETDVGCLYIENGVQINKDVKIDHTGGVLIKEGVLISDGVRIYSHTHGVNPRSAPIGVEKRIEANVWIGSYAIILEGCGVVGECSVIAAASVVTKAVPQHVIVGGNPAKLIRDLTCV